MADDNPDISAQWKALNPQQRDAALARMSPEQKQKLATNLGFKAPPATEQPEARKVGNYLSEAVSGAGRGLINDVTGAYQTVRHPIDTAKGLAKQLSTAQQASTKEFNDLESAYPNKYSPTRNAASMLTFAENAPIIGGMVQHAEKGGTKPFSPESVGAAAEGTTMFEAPKAVAKALTIASRALPETAGKIARSAAGAGPKTVKDLVKQTRLDNEDIGKVNAKAAIDHADSVHEQEVIDAAHKAATEKAEAENARAAQEHQQAVEVVDAENNAKIEEHKDQLQSVIDENARRQADFKAATEKAEALEKAAKEQSTEKGKLARQIKQNGARLINRIKQVQDTWKDSSALQKTKGYKPTGILDKAYAQIRKATAGATSPADYLSGAVNKAEGKIAGSTESLKIFRDILSKNPESEFIEGESVSPNSATLDEQPPYYGVDQGGTVDFRTLHGYYSEIGRAISKGGLPGDVYQALRSLQDDIGGQMQKMANDRGVGSLLKKTQAQYRDYMQTFREATGTNHSGSPIANALAAKDPSYAIDPLLKPSTAARVRNALSRFDPQQIGGAAKLYDNLRDANSRFEGIETVKVPESPGVPELKESPTAPPLKPRPTLEPPKTVEPPRRVQTSEHPPVIPEKKIGIEEIKGAHQKGIESRQGLVEHKTNWVAAGSLIYTLIDILKGEIPSATGVGASVGGALAIQSAVTRILTNPKVVTFLEKATPADIAQIPPELRGNLGPMIDAAQSKGIKVAPALIAAATGAAVAGQPRKGVAAALTAK